MDVSAHNVANVSTDGFHGQTVTAQEQPEGQRTITGNRGKIAEAHLAAFRKVSGSFVHGVFDVNREE